MKLKVFRRGNVEKTARVSVNSVGKKIKTVAVDRKPVIYARERIEKIKRGSGGGSVRVIAAVPQKVEEKREREERTKVGMSETEWRLADYLDVAEGVVKEHPKEEEIDGCKKEIFDSLGELSVATRIPAEGGKEPEHKLEYEEPPKEEDGVKMSRRKRRRMKRVAMQSLSVEGAEAING